ncbi:hypothetical protein MN608_09258 [Microdochium nivale]|nr:hypothetical protein MN608_09258 [Microdochium nivale]
MRVEAGTAPGYPEGYQKATGTLGMMINLHIKNRFPKWGFVVLRGVYDNDAEWATFISLYKANVADELHGFGLEDELGPHLEWTVIEDRATLENAPKDAVRARFLEWVNTRSVERDGEGAEAPWLVKSLPRFRYCLYIDELCFSTLSAVPVKEAVKGGNCRLTKGKIIIIDGTFGNRDIDNEPYPDEEDEDSDDCDGGWEPVEGNTEYDVGWAYINVLGPVELYSLLSCGGCDSEKWMPVYRGNRPDIQPTRRAIAGEPFSAIPQGVLYGLRGRNINEA